MKDNNKKREDARLKLVVTAKELVKVAKEKESIRLQLVVTAENLARIADEKEKIRLDLAETAKELAGAVVNKEKIRLELVVKDAGYSEVMNKLMIGRELTMAELKKENEELKAKLASK